MKKDIDILLDEDGDLMLDANGDPVVGDVTLQNIQLLLNTNPGDWKLYPTFGLGIVDYINSNELQGLNIKIKQMLERDGMKVDVIVLENKKIKIDAKY